MSSFLAFSPLASSPLRLLTCALLGPMVALGSLSATLGGSASVAGTVVSCVVAILALVPLVPRRVSVEASSVTIRWLTHARVLPFDRIASLDTGQGGFQPFVLTTRDGARLPILPVGWSASVTRARTVLAPLTEHLASRR